MRYAISNSFVACKSIDLIPENASLWEFGAWIHAFRDARYVCPTSRGPLPREVSYPWHLQSMWEANLLGLIGLWCTSACEPLFLGTPWVGLREHCPIRLFGSHARQLFPMGPPWDMPPFVVYRVFYLYDFFVQCPVSHTSQMWRTILLC